MARLIKYIEETFSISIISIKELKVIVEESIEFCDEAYDIEEMIKEKLIYMIEKKINNSKISKFMVSVINEEIVSTSLNRTLMRKITNKLIGDKLAH